MRVSKQITFDAAHQLPYYEGKCKNLHGHTWTVEVTCSGPMDENTGMVVDFGELKRFLEEVKSFYDHKYLNEILPNPTAENICYLIQKQFRNWCGLVNVAWESVKVWEGTSSSYVELRRE